MAESGSETPIPEEAIFMLSVVADFDVPFVKKYNAYAQIKSARRSIRAITWNLRNESSLTTRDLSRR